MAESFVQVNEGTGKKLHAWERTVGANTVYDSVTVLGEPVNPGYILTRSSNTSIATTGDHVFQLMAGATKALAIRRIAIWQSVLASAAGLTNLRIGRLTTAGTGGTGIGIDPLDESSPAVGASARALPTTLGAFGSRMFVDFPLAAAHPINAATDNRWEWRQGERSGALIVPAGTSNGIALLVNGGSAGAAVKFQVEFDEVEY